VPVVEGTAALSVAHLAIANVGAMMTSADVIIDNVAFGSNDAAELARVELEFKALCKRFNITIASIARSRSFIVAWSTRLLLAKRK
jgi:hypothetical protein